MTAVARAHSHPHAHTRTFPGHRTSVADARHWLEDLLARTDAAEIPSDTVAVAALLLSEAATNAVVHTDTGREPGGAFTVRVRIGDDTLTVHVEDDGGAATAIPAAPAASAVAAAPDTIASADNDYNESGRGLVLIDAFADDWGPVPEGHGHGVYYTLTRDPLAVRP